MKAIETRYRGYRFRSRLEARWAVFFDALGIPWEYESEGVNTHAGPYLPDFKLWGSLAAEVKPHDREIIEQAQTRLSAFCEDTGRNLLVLTGVPEFRWYVVIVPQADTVSRDWIDFGMSANKGRPWYAFMGPEWPSDSYLTIGSSSDAFMYAIHAARSARFEHGESPVVPRFHQKKKKAPTKRDELVAEMARATTKEEQDRIFDALVELSRQQQNEREGRGRNT